jgi:hypothetical protein
MPSMVFISHIREAEALAESSEETGSGVFFSRRSALTNPKLRLRSAKPSARQSSRSRFHSRCARKRVTRNTATEKGSASTCLGRLSTAVFPNCQAISRTSNTSRTKMSLSSADALKEEKRRHLIRALKEAETGGEAKDSKRQKRLIRLFVRFCTLTRRFVKIPAGSS